MPDDYFAKAASHLGKSERTYAQLLDAALIVFARDGFEAASINEITREAGVANGTFYSHFKNKDEISAIAVGKVLEETAKALATELDKIDDAAERVAAGTRFFARFASKHMHWGRAYVRAYWTFPKIRRRAQQFMRADIEHGVKQGRFNVKIDDFLIDATGSMAIAAIFPEPRSAKAEELGSMGAELQLRMLGVDLEEAHEIAWRPLDVAL
ncbi:MAG: helix-turn-helix domain-containing protein [Parvibaculaceae bacterium]